MKIYDFSLTERVEARIDHPEDLVWKYGSSGFKTAINALKYAQNNESSISLKWDGTPSLIFGRNPETGKFTLTDKSGFGATSYNGHPESSEDLFQMLYSRSPNQPNREQFAKTIASIWDYLENITPTNFRGYYQGDLLYVGTPSISGNNYVIKPNKISYIVPVDSKLGNKISQSKVGIAVHSVFNNKNISVPSPVKDISDLQTSRSVLAIPPRISNLKIYDVNVPRLDNIESIDTILDKSILKSIKISDFSQLIGRYINYMASIGSNDFSKAPTDFINWLETYNVSEIKKDRIKSYIKENIDAYNKLWEAISKVAEMKTQIKKQLDNQENAIILASIHGKKNHEGYVIATPFGKIKLVDRYIFMRKDQQ